MDKKLFLLDGMALAYRAHFALISRPIFTSAGVNTSALYGFTQTLLDILKNQKPTHIAVAFDTATPTHRHKEYPDYKATREAMPEDLSLALPHVRRMIEAFNIPILICEGFEADDIIGTLVRQAEQQGFQSYMVTPDKDFGQLVDANTFIYKPGRMGNEVEVLGLPEIRERWGVKTPNQVVDVLALMGDSSDNIPGVPGIGEKTAIKLIAQHGSLENLLAHTSKLTGRLKENVEKNREIALLSKRLATIICNAPCPADLETLKVQPPNDPALRALMTEFEFNSLGRRIFGEDFKAGRGGQSPKEATNPKPGGELFSLEGELDRAATKPEPAQPSQDTRSESSPPAAHLKTIADVPHVYHVAGSAADRARLAKTLESKKCFCFDTETTGLDPRQARLVGLAFSFAPHTGHYVPVPADPAEAKKVIEDFRPALESEHIEKVGHNLKFDWRVMREHGIEVRGKLFDTMIAHSLVEPEMRHGMDYLSEVYLGYTPIPISKLIGDGKSGQISMAEVPVEKAAEYAAEDADVTWQLRLALEPLLKKKGQERVFYEIESPLLPVLADMEREGIRVNSAALADFSAQLGKEISEQEKAICRLAGTPFNLNSPKQLGQILFDVMKISDAPKKTKTGQYSTDEQTLASLAPQHEIVQRLLDYRAASKLKSTYADALPETIWPPTGRIHTTYNQVMTTTGRLSSQNPNLQNIPIRTERGQEIRKAFVPREDGWLLLSADYSQIELRIIAALSHESAMIEAFKSNADIHTATAARVFGVLPDTVTPEMRRKAKMVNFGIIYGISPFGLSQRLGIARTEAGDIIDEYFRQFPGIRSFMDETIAFARKHGYVETVTGRRRYIRDINSSNNTIRSAAERNAINAPIQGTAADMIKVAMIRIYEEIHRRNLKTRMLLQVHDELVFDLFVAETEEVRPLVGNIMKNALPLNVPIEVEIGIGENWLDAH